MQTKNKEILQNFYYSFPIQLLLLNLKKHYLLLIFWGILFGLVTNSIASKYGIPYLLLDPEYLGKVNFISFLFLGASFGGFFITYNITSYILNSYRFPFLATLSKPFSKFCLNNFIIPVVFGIIYLYNLITFQTEVEFTSTSDVIIRMFGFVFGFAMVIFISFAYFFKTNHNISRVLGLGKIDPEIEYNKVDAQAETSLKKKILLERGWEVHNYMSSPFKIRLVRSTEHYDGHLLKAVFIQNHMNALIIEGVVILSLIILGYLTDVRIFRIPAGASVLLFFSITLMLIGALGFWLRGWRTLFFVGILLIVNFLMQWDHANYKHQVFGLNYNKAPVIYDEESIKTYASNTNLHKDRVSTLKILENWKAKFPKGEKPKMIFINVSGGGIRSAVWSMTVLQKLDSILAGDLMKQGILITGASGGMMGSAYFRELTLRKNKGEKINIYSKKHLSNMSKDLLNALTLTLAVNDVYNPFQKITIDNVEYPLDRGYSFERQFHENTGFILQKKISDYYEPEYNGEIPLMVLTPVIMNDAKNLIISPQDLSFLSKPIFKESRFYNSEIEGVEMKKMFKDHNFDNLQFSSALRMNATFPYVTPNVSLPTNPIIDIIDAGMRDNFGTNMSLKFLYNFKGWINTNTSGVVFLQIRDTPKFHEQSVVTNSLFKKIVNPIGNFFSNWQEFQDHQSDNLIGSSFSWYEGDIEYVSFQYINEGERRAALSWHLTTQEKLSIKESLKHELNQNSFHKIMKLLGRNYMKVN